MRNNTEEQQTQITNLVKKLISCDNPKHLLSNFTDMYVAYNQTDFADCIEERSSKSAAFLIILNFLGGLNTLKL